MGIGVSLECAELFPRNPPIHLSSSIYRLTADYPGYNAFITLDGIERLGWWAHARRESADAQKVDQIAGLGVPAWC